MIAKELLEGSNTLIDPCTSNIGGPDPCGVDAYMFMLHVLTKRNTLNDNANERRPYIRRFCLRKFCVFYFALNCPEGTRGRRGLKIMEIRSRPAHWTRSKTADL